jgi:methylphosphotriester-DNA--protein-cysteine methyltransferase
MTDTTEKTRQQLCAALGISESTVRRLEAVGLPFTPVGAKSKRYNLAECKEWLKKNQNRLCQSPQTPAAKSTSTLWSAASAFTAASRKAHLRVMPSA